MRGKEALREYLQEHHGLRLGSSAAAELVQVLLVSPEGSFLVRGLNRFGLPSEATLTRAELRRVVDAES
jgi:hypothetical protein